MNPLRERSVLNMQEGLVIRVIHHRQRLDKFWLTGQGNGDWPTPQTWREALGPELTEELIKEAHSVKKEDL